MEVVYKNIKNMTAGELMAALKKAREGLAFWEAAGDDDLAWEYKVEIGMIENRLLDCDGKQ